MICCSQIILPEPLTGEKLPRSGQLTNPHGLLSQERQGWGAGSQPGAQLCFPHRSWLPSGFQQCLPVFARVVRQKNSGPPLWGLQARGWAEEGVRGGSTEGLAVEEGAAAVRVRELRGEKTAGCQKWKWICCRAWRKDILILIHHLFKCWINMEVHSCQEQYFCLPVLLYFIQWFCLHHAPDDSFEVPSLVQGLLWALAKTSLPVTAGRMSF